MYGWHTVTAALRNPARRPRLLLATENAARRLADEGIAARIAPELVRPSAIAERLTPDAVHQGLYLEADPLPSPAIEDLPAQRRGAGARPDHRSAQCRRDFPLRRGLCGVGHRHHAAALAGRNRRAGQGRLRRARICAAGQRAEPGARACRAQSQRLPRGRPRFERRRRSSPALPLRTPLALVLGAEGKGLRQLTKETCDHVARIELPGDDQEPERVERGGARRFMWRAARCRER